MPERWHVNRGIPVVWLIGSIFIGMAQFGGFIWYASQFNTRVEQVERTQVTTAITLERVQASAVTQGEKLAGLSEKVAAIQTTANRIEALLVKPR